MSLSQALLPEFDIEMGNTRRVLERIPDDKLDWKAHPKSNTIGWVGAHLAELPGWTAMILTKDSLDVAPVGGEPYRTPLASSRQNILERFDKRVAEARAAIAAATDEQFAQPIAPASGQHDLHFAASRRAAELRAEPQSTTARTCASTCG